jgi:hypothetical protein
MKHYPQIAIFLATLSMVSGAEAALFTVAYDGVISQVSGATNPGVSLGESVELELTWDDDETGPFFTPNCSANGGLEYESSLTTSVTVSNGGGVTWSKSWTDSTSLFCLADDVFVGTSVYFDEWSATNDNTDGSTINGETWSTSFLFSNQESQSFASGEKQFLVLDADQGIEPIFKWHHIHLRFMDGNDRVFGLVFENTNPATTIPVPPAVWLFGSALGLLGWIKRRSA